MKNYYKVLGADGTDQDFELHPEAFEFIQKLDCYPKVLYKKLTNTKLGPGTVYAEPFSNQKYNLLHVTHKGKGYNCKVN